MIRSRIEGKQDAWSPSILPGLSHTEPNGPENGLN